MDQGNNSVIFYDNSTVTTMKWLKKLFNPPTNKKIIQFYTEELEYLEEKGYDVQKKWHKLKLGDLIALLDEYSRRHTGRTPPRE